MIQANELRIGNWISYDNNDVQVFELPYLIDIDEGKEDYLVNSVWLNEHEPIPLTPELLERCGFRKLSNEWVIQGPEYLEYFEMRYDKFYYTGGEGVCFGKGCEYLHQLQNLYFALTGTELTYQP